MSALDLRPTMSCRRRMERREVKKSKGCVHNLCIPLQLFVLFFQDNKKKLGELDIF